MKLPDPRTYVKSVESMLEIAREISETLAEHGYTCDLPTLDNAMRTFNGSRHSFDFSLHRKIVNNVIDPDFPPFVQCHIDLEHLGEYPENYTQLAYWFSVPHSF